jgi:hypothetical protein
MRTKLETSKDELRSNYEPGLLKDGIRGKYIDRLKSGSNLVLLEPDVAALYPDAKTVNSALRRLARSTGERNRPAKAKTA